MGKSLSAIMYSHCFGIIFALFYLSPPVNFLNTPVDRPQGKHFISVCVWMSSDLHILCMCSGSPGSCHTFPSQCGFGSMKALLTPFVWFTVCRLEGSADHLELKE